MSDDDPRIEELLSTMQSSINLLAGIISQHAELIATIEFHQQVDTEAWKREALGHRADDARDGARNAEGLRKANRTMDIDVEA